MIYDTNGQEKFNAINKSYYKNADAILLVYDISKRLSFNKIKDYYCNEIKEIFGDNIPIILLGNKTDLVDQRQVSQEEGVALAVSHNYKFQETSALKNENVTDAFEALIELWNFEYQKNNYSKTRTGSGDSPTKKKTLPRIVTMTNVNNKSLDLSFEDELRGLKLYNNNIQEPKNSTCC